ITAIMVFSATLIVFCSVVFLLSCCMSSFFFFFFFFFNDPPTTDIYTLSLHDALPISRSWRPTSTSTTWSAAASTWSPSRSCWRRSEEHTSELQSRENLVCRLLLEKKK